jgi:hypothetical protein
MDWSMGKGFHPVVQVTMNSSASPKPKKVHMSWKWIAGTIAGVVLTSAWLIMILSLLSIDAEFRLMKQALIQIKHQPPPAPSWAPAPIIQTVTTTVFVSPTPQKEITQETKPSPSPQTLSSAVPLPTTTASPSIIDIRHSASTAHPPPPVPPEKQEARMENALSPLYQLPLAWNLHFDLPPVAEETVEKVIQGLHKTWEILRRIYHYPLPPPT